MQRDISLRCTVYDMSAFHLGHKQVDIVTGSNDISIINREQGWLVTFSCLFLIQVDVRTRLSPSEVTTAIHTRGPCQHINSLWTIKNYCCKAHRWMSAHMRLHSVKTWETELLVRMSDSSNSAEMTLKGHCWYLREKFMCDKLRDKQELTLWSWRGKVWG